MTSLESTTRGCHSQSHSRQSVRSHSESSDSEVNIIVDMKPASPLRFEYRGPETYVDIMIAAKDLKNLIVQTCNNKAGLLRDPEIASRLKNRLKLAEMDQDLLDMETSLTDLEHRATRVKPEDARRWRDPCAPRKDRTSLQNIELHVSKINDILNMMDESHSDLTGPRQCSSIEYLRKLVYAQERLGRASRLEIASAMDTEHRRELKSISSKLQLAISDGAAQLDIMPADIKTHWERANYMRLPDQKDTRTDFVEPPVGLCDSRRLMNSPRSENDGNAADCQLLQELEAEIAAASRKLGQPGYTEDEAADEIGSQPVMLISTGTLEWPDDEVRAAFQ